MIDDGEGILFDPGSVLDFETVYNNIINLIPLEQINYVVLHHQDPDICGSLPLFEKAGANFKVVTHWRAAVLIKYYGIVSPFYIINENEFKLRLRSGRELSFIPTPYLHFPGAFATYDVQSKILFSSDLFGAFSYNWNLYADDSYVEKMKMFHEHYMPSNEIIRPVMEKLLSIDIAMIAPQHGSIIKDNVVGHIKVLRDLECGVFLKDTKKEVAKSGGYKLLVSLVLKRLYSIFPVNEVNEALEGLEISFDRNSYEVLDFNYRGVDLWNGLFENISKKKGMNWLVVLEPFVNKISKEYDVLVPDIYQSQMIDAQSEIWDLSSENVELRNLNEKLNQNIEDIYEQMTKCPMVISSDKTAKLLVTPSYNVMNNKFSSEYSRSGEFEEMKMMINSERVTKDGREIAPIYTDCSTMNYGEFVDNTYYQWYIDTDNVYVRLPWNRINFSDPSTMMVIDNESDVEDLVRDKLQISKSDGLMVSTLLLNNQNNEMIDLLSTDKPFVWPEWNEVDYKERLKESYYIIKDYFQELN